MEKAPVRSSFLPFSRPTIGDEEIDEVMDSLRSGWVTTGPKVKRFEEMFREWSGGKEAVAVNSGTAGLHLALMTLDLAPGDEVITSAITWPSTVNMIEFCGAIPIFADVHKGTLQIAPEDVEKKLSPRTKAVIPVHFAGAPCDMDALYDLCRDRGIEIVEDAAHAIGTEYKGEPVGWNSEMTVFSFHAIKNMTTGEGGMVLCKDSDRADRMRKLRFHGISRDTWKRYAEGGVPQYEVFEPGFKYNMLDLEAAIGIHQFQKLGEFNEKRRALAQHYLRLFVDTPEILPLSPVNYPHLHAWHLFVVRLDLEAVSLDRDQFLRALQQENIGTGLHFPAVHLQKYYKDKYGFKRGDLPNAEWNSDRLFSLPLYPLLSEQDQKDVVQAVRKILGRHRR